MPKHNSSPVSQELWGTGSVLLNASARVMYSLRALGIRRTAALTGRSLAYYVRCRNANVCKGRGPAITALSCCSWIRSVEDVDIADCAITSADLQAFISDFHYPYYYYAGARRVWYALWHMIGLQACDFTPHSVVLDVGAQSGIWGKIVRRKYGCKVFDVDLRYRPGIRGNRIGADARAIPLSAQSVTHIVTFCAFNCFEGTADIGFIHEASRLLRPEGKLIIVPLCIADAHVNLYDPVVCTRPDSFDPDADRVAWPGWRNNFGRWYDRTAFVHRILANTLDFDKTIWRVRHPRFEGKSSSEFYVARFTNRSDCSLASNEAKVGALSASLSSPKGGARTHTLRCRTPRGRSGPHPECRSV